MSLPSLFSGSFLHRRMTSLASALVLYFISSLSILQFSQSIISKRQSPVGAFQSEIRIPNPKSEIFIVPSHF
jgi:hypothetical protein